MVKRQGAGGSPAQAQGVAGLCVAWRASFTHLSFLLQLWYFWRRRLFIWISFLDSYFELLLYVESHSSFISGPGEVVWQRSPSRL